MAEAAKAEGGASGLARWLGAFALFTGGDLQQSTIFGLGIMPYISASIIFQLLGHRGPLAREASEGR